MSAPERGFSLDQFRLDEELGVFVHPALAGFAYSDSETSELELYKILKSATDRRSTSRELEAQATSWAHEYHLSRARSNLIRHLELQPTQSVLELGAGCGAITRWLGESGAQVVAVEGSELRARCARARCNELENVRVFAGDFGRIEFEPSFDFVTLIGALEYAPGYFASADPIQDVLRIAKSALRPAGCLVVAIENQLGLKYFSGATEDHTRVRYLGIEDRYRGSNVRTLGLRELTSQLHEAGFADVEFQYPFPDYKLPIAVLFEAAFDRADFLPDEIVRHFAVRDYSGQVCDGIDASLVWPVLARNGLMQALSNSFLVLASNGGTSRKLASRRTLALKYATDRAEAFCAVTEFFEEHAGRVRVSKRGLSPGASAIRGAMRQRLDDSEYLPGRTLHSSILEELKLGDLTSAIAHLRRWLSFLQEHECGTSSGLSWNARLPGDFVDALPFNLICREPDRLERIDDEWLYSSPLSLGATVSRYLLALSGEESALRALGVSRKHAAPQAEAIRRLLKQLGLRPDPSAYEELKNLQVGIDDAVYPGKRTYLPAGLREALENPGIELTKRAVRAASSDMREAALWRRALRRLGVARRPGAPERP